MSIHTAIYSSIVFNCIGLMMAFISLLLGNYAWYVAALLIYLGWRCMSNIFELLNDLKYNPHDR